MTYFSKQKLCLQVEIWDLFWLFMTYWPIFDLLTYLPEYTKFLVTNSFQMTQWPTFDIVTYFSNMQIFYEQIQSNDLYWISVTYFDNYMLKF